MMHKLKEEKNEKEIHQFVFNSCYGNKPAGRLRQQLSQSLQRLPQLPQRKLRQRQLLLNQPQLLKRQQKAEQQITAALH